MTGYLSLEVPVAAVALIGAIAYGGGDFMGGRAAAKLSPPGAIALAQCTAMLVAVQAFSNSQLLAAPMGVLGVGIAGGTAYAAGLLRLYQGVAFGRIAIVAPVCGVVGILVPLAGDLALAREIGSLQFVGIGFCAVAISLLAGTPEPSLRVSSGRSSFRLGVESGLGYGVADLCLGTVAPSDGPAALSVARCMAALIAIVLLLTALWPRNAITQRSSAALTSAGNCVSGILLPGTLAIAAGALDALGHMSYIHVATQGSMAVASAVVALFPAVVVLLAVLILREPVTALQWTGLATSLAGIMLIFL